MSARRTQLEHVVRRLMPRVRLDAALTDRQLGLQILAALKIDPETTFSACDLPGDERVPLSRRSDVYLTEYALCSADPEYAASPIAELTEDR